MDRPQTITSKFQRYFHTTNPIKNTWMVCHDPFTYSMLPLPELFKFSEEPGLTPCVQLARSRIRRSNPPDVPHLKCAKVQDSHSNLNTDGPWTSIVSPNYNIPLRLRESNKDRARYNSSKPYESAVDDQTTPSKRSYLKWSHQEPPVVNRTEKTIFRLLKISETKAFSTIKVAIWVGWNLDRAFRLFPY